MKFPLTWDLKRFYSGGSQSKELHESFKQVQELIEEIKKAIHARKDLPEVISKLQKTSLHMRNMGSFITCLGAQDVKDTGAHLLQDKITSLEAAFSTLLVHFDEWLISLSDGEFEELLTTEKDIAFPLAERRHLAQEKLSAKEETFIHDFAIDGYHGWSQIWETQIGEMTFPYADEALSFGQVENKMADNSSTAREEAFTSIGKQFKKQEDSFAQILNHLAGFRLKIYEKRGWPSFLKDPLADNRMQEKTLRAMWETIEQNKPHLLSYLKCKAALLQKEKLSWYDLEAPIGQMTKKIPYDEAAAFILKNFEAFSPKLGAFSKKALEGHWIEAEDRVGKRPGGFCIDFPIQKESRIFMTYAETMTNVFTLAHELGHAFHSDIVFALPELAQHYKMNVAETASTMAEAIVTRAAIKQAKGKNERLSLLDDHLSRTISYLMNIHARFLFETRFYEERKKGYVPACRLSSLMEEAQKEAYLNSLDTYHPHFWAAKMHFFFTDVPFYNFPYTFGYLFSMGIYALAQHTPHFEDRYMALLRDTGQMDVETLAHKHLEVDLSSHEFWQIGLDLIKQDITEFQSLC